MYKRQFISFLAALLIAGPCSAQAPRHGTVRIPTQEDPDPGSDRGNESGGSGFSATPLNNRLMQPDDPNLSKDWRWWEDDTRQTVYFSQNDTTPQVAHPFLPWNTPGNILNGYQVDVHPADGWVLAYKDFGTSEWGVQFPYFALYNRYRGKLRLMVWKPYREDYSYYQAEIKFISDVQNNPQSTALLTFTAEEKSFLDNFNPRQVDSCVSDMAVYGSWGVFDFDLAGYDPKLENLAVDPYLEIAIQGVKESKLKTKSGGEIELRQLLGTSALLNGSRSDNSMEAFKKAILEGSKTYKSIADFQKDFKKALEDQGKKKEEDREWWYKSALELLPVAAVGWAPIAGALFGAVTSFLGGSNKSAPMEPLNFKGLIDLSTEGTITDSNAKMILLDLYLKPGLLSPKAQRPVQQINWGIYNWTSKPKLTWEDHYIDVWKEFPNAQGDMIPEHYRDEYVDTRVSSNVPEVIINPNLDMTLISKKVVFYTGALGAYGYSAGVPSIERPFGSNEMTTVLDTPYDGYGIRRSRMDRPIVMGLELNFRINGNVVNSDKDIKILKTYPVTFDYIRKYVGWEMH